jgi:hypothetical protein
LLWANSHIGSVILAKIIRSRGRGGRSRGATGSRLWLIEALAALTSAGGQIRVGSIWFNIMEVPRYIKDGVQERWRRHDTDWILELANQIHPAMKHVELATHMQQMFFVRSVKGAPPPNHGRDQSFGGCFDIQCPKQANQPWESVSTSVGSRMTDAYRKTRGNERVSTRYEARNRFRRSVTATRCAYTYRWPLAFVFGTAVRRGIRAVPSRRV